MVAVRVRKKSILLLLVLLGAELLAQTGFTGIHPAHATVAWSPGISLTPLGSIEEKPYVIEDSHSNLWVAYESNRLGNWTIWMRQFNGVAWLPEQQLTNSTSNSLTPALAQLNNGNVMLVYTSDKSGNFSLYYQIYGGGVWSNPSRLTTPQGRDSTPTLSQLRNGTVVMYWTRESLSGSVVRYIHSKSYVNGTWSKEARFSTGGSEEEPSVYQTDDGKIWLVYAANRSGNLDIFYETYSGSWSSEVRLTSNSADDHQSWLIQDLNGMLWEFWTRCVPISGGACQDDVFYITSSNLGATWSAEVQFTVDPTGFTINDSHPTAIHYDRDKMMYVFWGTDLTGPGADFDAWLRTSNPMPIHHVTLTNATRAPNSVMESGTVKVNFTANNPGDYKENVTITGYYQSRTSLQFNFTTVSVMPGSSMFLRMSWNTSKVAPANYTIYLYALPVPGESVRLYSGNTAVAGNATVQRVAWDVNSDGKVNVLDLAAVALRFGQSIGPEDIDHDCDVDVLELATVAVHFGAKPGDPNWFAAADVNGDGVINVLDLAQVALKYGTSFNVPEDINHDCAVNVVDLATVALHYGFGT
jgi:Dockerin type I domain